jgi:hypothetical protein
MLAIAPVRELNGLVGAAGLTAARFGAEKHWTVQVVLAAWREQGGPIQPALTLEALASHEQVARLKEQLPANTVVSLRVRMPPASEHTAEHALLEEVRAVVTDDAQLNELLRLLQAPKSLYFEVIGAVSLDSMAGLYKAVVTWCGQAVTLVLPVEAEHDLNDAAQLAQRLLGDQENWQARVLVLVTDKMLPLKNDTWRNEGEAAVTAAALRAGITLTSIWVDTDGSVDFGFDGGDHFLGHAIHVSGTLESGPTDVELAG